MLVGLETASTLLFLSVYYRVVVSSGRRTAVRHVYSMPARLHRCYIVAGCVPCAADGTLLKTTLLFRFSHRDDRWSDDHYEREKREVDWNFHKDSFFCDVPSEWHPR